MRKTRLFALVGVVALVIGLAFTGIASADDEDFRTQMTGAQEVPPADPDGSARGKVEIDVAAGEVCFKFSWKKIATPTLGHIHNAPAGANGPIVVDLLGAIPPDTLEADDDVRGCVTADSALLGLIVSNPDQYYLNLHNPRFPAGAVRGQLG
jgi:CHRD domain